MTESQVEAQPKSAQINVRCTPEERDLVHDLAAVLGTSASALAYEHGVEKAAQMAREAQERFARRTPA